MNATEAIVALDLLTLSDPRVSRFVINLVKNLRLIFELAILRRWQFIITNISHASKVPIG